MAAIPDGARLLLAPGCGLPRGLVAALKEHRFRWRRLSIVVGYLFEPLSIFDDAGAPFTFTSLHPTPALRSIAPEHLNVVPVRYSDVPAVLGEGGALQPDAVLVQVSAPDGNGRCSLGVSVGSVIDAVRSAPLVIAQVNELAPYTYGDAELSMNELDLLVEAATPLVEVVDAPATPSVAAIGEHVASEVPDGATIQIGVGRVPTAVLAALAGHRDLSLHSGLFTGGCRRLIEAGALTGVCVTAELFGDAGLYAWVDHNPTVRLVSARTSHGLASLMNLRRFVAINSGLEVDLTGAVNAEYGDDGQLVSGPGGLPDFATAALSMSDGTGIVALPATSSDGRRPRIVSSLDGRTTLPAYLADRVVTDRGVARLRGRSLDERRRALLAIA
jgi:acyl-CoA hydrolase